MKRRLSIFLLIVFISCSLFASEKTEIYLAPMTGANGIPMNPIRETGNMRYTPITGFADRDGVEVGKDNLPWSGHKLSNLKEGHFTDEEMIALGGIKGLTPFEASHAGKCASLEITATCPNGFYFVSQSNPAYKRPFELYVLPMIYTYRGNRYPKYEAYPKYGKERVLSETSYSVNFTYDQLLPEEFNKNYPEGVLTAEFPHQIWFDMVLVLPGDIENDVLTIGSTRYPLTEADDYSAVVNIAMKATYPTWHWEWYDKWQITGGWEFTKMETVVKTITIPFSGFYESEQKVRQESTVSMYVHPVAAAGNIDMRNYGRQQIADIEVMSVDTIGMDDNKTSKNFAYGLFLSSSEDPYTPGDHFKLVKENLEYDQLTNLSVYNSVDYDVILVEKKKSAQSQNEVKYDGTMSVKSTDMTEANCSNVTGLVVPERTSVNNTHSVKVDSWYYAGEAYIKIHDNGGVVMEAGRYTSNIYVHVMGF